MNELFSGRTLLVLLDVVLREFSNHSPVRSLSIGLTRQRKPAPMVFMIHCSTEIFQMTPKP